ncbi:MAG: helix-turn-helix domain-containing protein [Oscillospiraceae bacterium]|nr:helix-turn-helix domain-containing protein [Oscillospiraceae bacterium]
MFVHVPFEEIFNSTIATDPELKKMWDESRTEYQVLGELIKMRKEKGMSQSELAAKAGSKQQVISRIENKESSPTLKTMCRMLDVLGYDIQFVPRKKA